MRRDRSHGQEHEDRGAGERAHLHDHQCPEDRRLARTAATEEVAGSERQRNEYAQQNRHNRASYG